MAKNNMPAYLLDQDDLSQDAFLNYLEGLQRESITPVIHNISLYLVKSRYNRKKDAIRRQRLEEKTLDVLTFQATLDQQDNVAPPPTASDRLFTLVYRVFKKARKENKQLLSVALEFPFESSQDWGKRLGIERDAIYQRIHRIRALVRK